VAFGETDFACRKRLCTRGNDCAKYTLKERS